MKKAELKEYIKSRIKEIITVDVSQDPSQLTSTQKRTAIQNLRSKQGNPKIGTPENPVEFIEEMARKAVSFIVAPDFKEKAEVIETGGPISPSKLDAILDFIDGKSSVTGPEIATGVGYPGKLPRVYPVIAALIDAGALVVPETSVPEPSAAGEEEVEFRFREEEPEPEGIERTTVAMDPDTQTAATFTVENADLISSIIRNYKDSKARVKMNEADDLDSSRFTKAALKSKESSVGRLDRKIDELASKISEFSPEVQAKILELLDFKFKSVEAGSLTKMIARKIGQEAPSVDVDFEEEDLMEDSGVEDVDYGVDAKYYDEVYERMNKLVNYKG